MNSLSQRLGQTELGARMAAIRSASKRYLVTRETMLVIPEHGCFCSLTSGGY